MKNWILTTLPVLLIGCKKETPAEALPPANDTIPKDPIVHAVIGNVKGDTLKIDFNTELETGIFRYRGQIFTLRQDTMASGIQYSNPQYKYSEWQGKSKLEQDGKTIFTNE